MAGYAVVDREGMETTMQWSKVNRLVNNSVFTAALIIACSALAYYSGYPWTCDQAIHNRNIAQFRAKRAAAENYPRSNPYRQYREAARRNAESTVEQKCIDPQGAAPNSGAFSINLTLNHGVRP